MPFAKTKGEDKKWSNLLILTEAQFNGDLEVMAKAGIALTIKMSQGMTVDLAKYLKTQYLASSRGSS